MNSDKSRQRASLQDDRKYDRNNNNKFIYPMKEEVINKSYSQKDKGPTRKDKNTPKKLNESDLQGKQNEALFKNMQKCNQKMEYYKLMGSLQEQKKTMLQQENYFLKTQNDDLKQSLQTFKKQIKRLSKRLQKLNAEIQNYRIKQNDMNIQIPGKIKDKEHSKSSQLYNQQSVQDCGQCIQLSQRFEEERNLYERDRKYLKQQIDSLKQTIDDMKKQQKIVNKQLEGRSFTNKKQIELIQRFKNKQNQLKKQLTFSYKAFQQKCKLISELESQIDSFEEQNQRILKLLALFDQKNFVPKVSIAKYQSFPIKRQERARSSYNVKNKNFQYSALCNQKQGKFEDNLQNLIQNRKRNRKCGSIQKIEML